MAATDVSISIGIGVETGSSAANPTGTRRSITPEAGRALEKLGHAIEYLTDEYVHAGRKFRTDDPELEAIMILMSLNRQIYFECPVEQRWSDRVKTLLRNALA